MMWKYWLRRLFKRFNRRSKVSGYAMTMTAVNPALGLWIAHTEQEDR